MNPISLGKTEIVHHRRDQRRERPHVQAEGCVAKKTAARIYQR
jgi:hypothetical protein